MARQQNNISVADLVNALKADTDGTAELFTVLEQARATVEAKRKRAEEEAQRAADQEHTKSTLASILEQREKFIEDEQRKREAKIDALKNHEQHQADYINKLSIVNKKGKQ